MKFVNSTAIGLALAVATVSASPVLAKKAEPAAAKQDFSPAFVQAAQPLQKALTAKDYAGAKAALPAAQAAASTGDDKYNLGIMQFQIAQATNDTAGESAGADLVIGSGKAPADTLAQILDAKGRIAYNGGDFRGADAAFTQLVQMKPADGDTAILLAAVKTREGLGAQALPIVDQAIAAKKAANQPVPEDWYRRALGIAYDSKPPMPAGVIKYGQQLAAAYPSPKAWRDVLQTYRATSTLDTQTNLDTMRLMRAAGALAGERDYYEYASAANDRGYPGEAKAVIDEGISSNMVENKAIATSKALTEIKQMAGSKVAADKAGLPALDKKARTAADGKAALTTADAYLGYNMYPQAIDLYKVALQKGGADANLVNMRLGIALARSGQKTAAAQAFGQVTGPRQVLAQYWTIWANQQPGS